MIKSNRKTKGLVRKGAKLESIQLKGGYMLSKSLNIKPNNIFLDHQNKLIINKSSTHNFFKRFSQNNNVLAKFNNIEDVLQGIKTEKFNDLLKQDHHKDFTFEENQCLSIVLANDIKTIDLIAPNNEIRNKWFNKLQFIIRVNQYRQIEYGFQLFLKEQFNAADTDRSGSLSFKEILALLNKLNISFDKHEAKLLFKQANFRKSGNLKNETLDIDEFIKFYELLSFTKVLDKEFKKITQASYLEHFQLMKFMKITQKSNSTTLDQDCTNLITKHEPLTANTNSTTQVNILTSKGFRNMITSPEFEITGDLSTRINQDMTRPLTNYYIATSHNTYLYNDQIEGRSTTETFRMYLLQGCRSVELDVTDGDEKTDYEPVVCHKMSLTSKTKLSEFVRTIREFAFKTSPYPIIISLENNFKKLDSQRFAAKIFKEGLGDYLIIRPLNDDENKWPSPEQLKEKIIIKGKQLPAFDANVDIDELEKEKNLAKELSDLVWYGKSRSLSTFQNTINWKYNEMTSIEENNSKTYTKKDKQEYQKFTAKHIAKVYPHGLRVLSGNFNPLPHWNCGAQMVALNYQTKSNPMWLNKALFETNANCGYVLKAEHLLNQRYNYPYRKCILKLILLSAINLPELNGKIINPYVELRIFGVKRYKYSRFNTKTVRNNGFNPQWNKKWLIKISSEDAPLTFLRFRIYDSNFLNKNSFVAQRIVAFNAMSEGYRNITLHDKSNTTIDMAKIIVKIEKNMI